jgi:cardiolipin synthase
VPRPAFTEALANAARRGVQVRVLVPGPHTDKPLVRIGGQASYETLLAAGAHIFEYQPTMLHSKTMIVDGAWSSVGTVNFDNRSFQLHDEVTLCTWSEHFAELLHESFAEDLTRSNEIDPDD